MRVSSMMEWLLKRLNVESVDERIPVDSLTVMETIFDFEDEFEVKVPMRGYTTVKEILTEAERGNQ